MRLAAGVEYDGSAFFGWQRQRQSPTVQECLEDALSKVADRPLTVHCAGRTDTGVHAVCQVVHFDPGVERTSRSWVLGTNTHLPAGISLLWVEPVDETFHARFSAARRQYRYRVLNRWVRPAIDHERVAWIRHPLDAGRMHESAQALVGEHDFSSFRAVGCQAKSPVRTIDRIVVERRDDEIVMEVRANAFIYHMVRNIAGTLIPVGTGEKPLDWTASVLAARDRTVGGVTAPARGLYFLGPEYPDYPALPIGQPVGFPRTA